MKKLSEICQDLAPELAQKFDIYPGDAETLFNKILDALMDQEMPAIIASATEVVGDNLLT